MLQSKGFEWKTTLIHDQDINDNVMIASLEAENTIQLRPQVRNCFNAISACLRAFSGTKGRTIGMQLNQFQIYIKIQKIK